MLYIGANAASNAQYAINVHSNNLANVDTIGYRRRTVMNETEMEITTNKGQMGTGADISHIIRNSNEYIEKQYLSQSSETVLWQSMEKYLGAADALFTTTETTGVTLALSAFWNKWDDLAANPSDPAVRKALLTSSSSLASMLNGMSTDLQRWEKEAERELGQEVAGLNSAMQDLAKINASIVSSPDNYQLLDERDRLVREISEYVPVDVDYDEFGQASVVTTSGQSLVDEASVFKVSFEDAQSYRSNKVSDYEGELHFGGDGTEELLVEFVDDGSFKVSLDDGKTWVTNEDGTTKTFPMSTDPTKPVEVAGTTIWFDAPVPATNLPAAGDGFTVVTDPGLYWYKNTSTKENISTISANDPGDRRLEGGSLAGLLSTRNALQDYQTQLDSFSETLIWEVNRIHSVGAGVNPNKVINGSYGVSDPTVPLGESNLDFAKQLHEGEISFAIYDKDGKFAGMETIAFDPAVDSLNDIEAKIDALPGMEANVVNGKLVMTGEGDNTFNVAADSSGLMAGLGMNTFFTGSDADDIEVNAGIIADSNKLNAGKVNGAGEANSGDNSIAKLLSELVGKDVTIYDATGPKTMTIGESLNRIVVTVGSDVAEAKTNRSFHEALAKDLQNQQESIAGVNRDEELVKIQELQQAYSAASRIIQTSLDLYDTILSLK